MPLFLPPCFFSFFTFLSATFLVFSYFFFCASADFAAPGQLADWAFAPFAQLLPAPWALACWAVWFWLAAPCVCANKAEAAINDAKTKNSFNDFFIFFLFADKYLSVLQVYINGCFCKHLNFFYSFLKPIKYSTFPSPPFMGDSISPTSFASLKFAST